MNFLQRRVLFACAVAILAMLLFPPFQVNGLGFGYAFLLNPPHDRAIINAGQLIAQWIAVVLLGGIAFLLIKDTSDSTPLNSLQSLKVLFGLVRDNRDKRGPTTDLPGIGALAEKIEHNPVIKQAAMTAFNSSKNRSPVAPQSNPLYSTTLGDRACGYYLQHFEKLDQAGDKFIASWNWGAFFGGGVWALYRKMYGWFFGFWALTFIVNLIDKKVSTTIAGLAYLIPAIGFSIYANSIYYQHIREKIATAGGINSPESLVKYLTRIGGVHRWVLWLAIALPVIGISASIVIPMFLGPNTAFTYQ